MGDAGREPGGSLPDVKLNLIVNRQDAKNAKEEEKMGRWI
jgi:hypothetical protein